MTNNTETTKPEAAANEASPSLSALLAETLPHLKARLDGLKKTYPADVIVQERQKVQILIDKINITIYR